MKRALLAALVAGLLAAPPVSAGNVWYWSKAKAEIRLSQHGAVLEVYGCRGYSQGIKSHGVKMWRRYLCEVELEGGRYSADLRVRGRNLYRVWFAKPDQARR